MPPILLILGFVGLPIVTAGLYSLGHFGGLNSTTAAIGQHQHEPGRRPLGVKLRQKRPQHFEA